MPYTKATASLTIVLALVLVLSPITENWADKPEDGFPLSYYPMFAKERAATYSIYHLVGYDEAGTLHRLPYQLAGSGGFNQVRRQLNRYAKNGEGEKLVAKAAQRLARRDPQLASKLVEIALVRSTYETEAFFLANQQEPVKVKRYHTLALVNDQ